MTQHTAIAVGSNVISQCVRTLEYLKRKHWKMIEGPDVVVVPDRKIGGRGPGKPRGPSLSPAEHDAIYVDAQRPEMSLMMIARKYNRTTSVVCRVRNKRHPLYDPVRSEAALAAYLAGRK